MPSPSSASNIPYWVDSVSLPHYPAFDADAHADVVIVGGGITGLTAAYLLTRAGKSVVLLERGRCAGGDTGHTTAHLTMVTDTRLTELVRQLGQDHAQAVWDAGLAAIAFIDETVGLNRLDCGFEWVLGYLHLPAVASGPASEADAQAIKEEAALAFELGFDAEFVAQVPLFDRPGMRVDGQARFHPRRYLAGLASVVSGLGGRIYESSPASEFSASAMSVTCNGHTVTCEDIIIATHNPIAGLSNAVSASLLQTKLALYSSYVVAGRVAAGRVADALFWDTADPYHYLRVQPLGPEDLVIFGGEDHKTGQAADTEACFVRLEQKLRQLVPDVRLDYRWSGQVIETPDGLPFIGPHPEHQFIATGFSGNGMTFGTLGAMLCTDAILERRNPWFDLFDPSRKALGRSLWEYMKENADYPYYMVRGRFAGAEDRPLRSIGRGEGKVVERNGRKIAAYRDPGGSVTLKSAICTHMGCVVGWNQAERTWDCPCHGSRFAHDGRVLAGPAESPLAEVEDESR